MSRRFLIVSFYSMLLIALILTAIIKAEDSAIRLITHKADGYHCKWSPDGRHIAFTSQRSGEAKLYIIPAGGGDAVPVECGLTGDHHTGWSPDSRYLVFDAYGPDGPPPRLWLIPADGGAVKPLLADIAPAFQPALSPDGNWIAFVSMRSGNTDIWKAKLNGDSLTQVTRGSAGDHHPQWSPDSKSLVFSSNRSGNWDVWIMCADGTGQRRITDAPEDDDQACVSPDGKSIAFMSMRSGKRDIWVMPITGGTARRVTQEGENGWPSFSPDGKYLVWSSKRDGQDDLYVGKVTADTVVDIDGNEYATVTIGAHTWMAENLKVTHYRDGSSIPYVSDDTVWSALSSGAYCRCNDDPVNYGEIYGALYNFHAVIDSRCLCPEGWHIPTEAEWTQLVDYLGGKDVAGGKMKKADTAGWSVPNIGATNESGFGGLPGGGHGQISGCGEVGNYGTWWSSTSYDSIYAWHWGLYHGNAKVRFNPGHKASGFSVRCVKD